MPCGADGACKRSHDSLVRSGRQPDFPPLGSGGVNLGDDRRVQRKRGRRQRDLAGDSALEGCAASAAENLEWKGERSERER